MANIIKKPEKAEKAEKTEKVEKTEKAEKAEKAKKARNFVFTMYNVDEDKTDILENLVRIGFVKTIFFTHELGSEGNNPHVQGFLSCQTPNSLNNVKNKLNDLFEDYYEIRPNPHIEIAKGTAYQNFIYITKELKDNPNLKHQLFGDNVLPPGKKRDDSKFESYVELLEKGKIKLKEIEEKDLAHYQRHEAHYLGVYSKLCKRGIKPPSFVAWFAGPTGTGKSSTVRKLAEILDFDIYDMDCQNNFFNHYSGEEISVWDDYRSGPISFSALLKITDRYGTNLNIKGGKVWFNPRIQIYTSPDGIDSAKTVEMKCDFIGKLDNKFEQLKRRVSYYITFEKSEIDSIPTYKNVLENSDQVISNFLGTYRQFLIDTGYEEFVDLIPNLNKYEPIPIKKLIKESETCKVSFRHITD